MVRIYSGSRVVVQLKAAEVIEGELARVKKQLKAAERLCMPWKANRLKERIKELILKLDEM